MHVRRLFVRPQNEGLAGLLKPSPEESWCLKGPCRKFDYNRDEEYIHSYNARIYKLIYIRFNGIFVKIKFFLSRRLLHTGIR